MWLRRKTKEDERENLTLISKMVVRLVEVEARTDKLKQDVDSLRGLVNRKLGNHQPSTDRDRQSEEYKKDDGFGGIRGLIGA